MKYFIVLVGVILSAAFAFAENKPPFPILTASECEDQGGKITDVLTSSQCAEGEIKLGEVTGVKCPCICCGVKNENNNPSSASRPSLVEVMLFLNANFLPPGASSYKMDKEKKLFQYFDAEGRIVREQYVDTNGDGIVKEYNSDGTLKSETKITNDSLKKPAMMFFGDQQKEIKQ